ncbi:protein 4.1b isoform X1 [Danio rerio]|uniref:Protein 4.1 n=2 Tax=Danio rerio TaxID=7955 RepID=Q8JG61_DANRE|nr:protein 4.1b [Danio rerio]AAI62616.1 Erythrocyte membrane protein band 4.1 (elliptocytosis 1, RH-linked) [Danio rerio]AAM94025.1 protein 4.1 [Danio rerio]|eukprot:NP_778259.1 erythrocyte membrane protein band 4.1b [Danio rerio]
MLQCRVNFLDDTLFTWELERDSLGQDLFNKVCEHLNLLERDYFGLVMWDSPTNRVWLDCAKEIRKQIKSPVAEFFFSIKFYPPDPSILAEDITRYFLCLHLRKDILIGRLPCPSDILALLGSYTVQSTLGDYDPNLHKNNYVRKIVLAPNQSKELEEKVMELHATYRFMSPAQADLLFLENVMGLPMYGVDLHPAKDASGEDVMLGVCSEGLIVYEDGVKTNSFFWPRVLKISHKRNTFLLKMRPSEEDASEGNLSFSLANYRACKQLWKCSVEHHSFFRNRLQDTKAKRLLTLGSRFRYHGRKQSECVEASSNITRAPPRFTRYSIKRKANEEILDVLKLPVRAEVDDWFLVYGPEKWHIYTSDDVMLESQKLQEYKHHADDWCVLLDGSPFSLSGVQQLLQTEEQREDLETSKEKLTDEFEIKQSYQVQVVHERSDVLEKELPDYEIMRNLNEELLEVGGERIQRVVMTKEWTQTQDNGEKRVERVERRVIVTNEKMVGSGDTSESLEIMEQRLEKVEAIGRKLVEVEELRVGLQEVESLEQRLQQAEKEGLQLMKKDDWYIFLDCRPLTIIETLRERPGVVRDELQQIVYVPKPIKKEDDWFILFDVHPQTTEISQLLSDVSSSIPEGAQAEEVKREVEKIELVLPEKPKTLMREETIQSRVTTEEIQKEHQEQVTVNHGRSQTAILEQRATEPQSNQEDDWFVVLDGSPKTSASTVKSTSVEFHEETREEVIQRTEQKLQVTVQDRRPQPITVEKRTTQAGDVEDDWFIIFDVSPKETVRGPAVEVFVESREQEIQSRVRKEERVIEVMTVSTREQITVPETKRISVTQIPQFPVEPRDIDDDWFQLFDKVLYEEESFPSVRGSAVEVFVESREQEIQSRVRKEERVIEVTTVSTREQITVPETKRISVTQIPQFPVESRDIDDDWFQLFDKVLYEEESFPSVQGPAVEVFVESREQEIQSRVRKEERVIEVMTVGTREQITVPETKRISVTQIPQFPVEPRDIDDDWFQLFDKVPYEEESFPSVQGPAVFVESREQQIESRVRKEERVIKVMTVSTREQITVTKRISVTQIPQFPVEPRDIDDDWFQLFDKVPYEKESFPSDIRSREFELRESKDQRVQRVVEEQFREKRLIAEERRVSIDERRKAAEVLPQMIPVEVREVDNDWFELLDQTSYQKRSVPSVSVVSEERRIKEQEDRRVRQQQMRGREEEEERRLRKPEKPKQELEARRAQPSITVATHSQPQIEDDWFILFDVLPKETVVADVLKVERMAEEQKGRVEERKWILEEERRKLEEERRLLEKERRRREEEMWRREEEKRIQIKAEERLKRAAVSEERAVQLQTEVEDDWYMLMGITLKDYIPSAPSTPVISPVSLPKLRPQIPVDQPLTSTPTAQSASITKTYKERTKDILDITVESEAETESSLMRRTWTKKTEGESIYVRHSILMLEDLDVSQEMIMKHHASVTELKRVFMEVKDDFGPTEWDRRLSSYSPTLKPQLPHANGEILVKMGLMDENGKTILLRTQEEIFA